MRGTEPYHRWPLRASVYVIAMSLAGAATGATLAAAGAGVDALWPDARLPLAAALGVIALAFALHELEFVRMSVPGRDWQVPVEWVRSGYYQSAVVWGVLVGAGVFTRITYAILPVLLAWLFVSGNVLFGALAGLTYGATRAASIYLSASTHDSEETINLGQRLMGIAPAAHQWVGLALAAFAVYLLAAPYIP